MEYVTVKFDLDATTWWPTKWDDLADTAGTVAWNWLHMTCPKCSAPISMQGGWCINFCPSCGHSFTKDREEVLKEKLEEVETLLKEIKELM